jgi:hypothetical protein
MKKAEIKEFLKTYGTKVLATEPEGYVELMMDNHICIRYYGTEYYVAENNMFYSEADNDMVDYLKERHHV